MFKKTKRIAPKVVKLLTPWWLRWLYSIYGEHLVEMATATISPDALPSSTDNAVGYVKYKLFYLDKGIFLKFQLISN